MDKADAILTVGHRTPYDVGASPTTLTDGLFKIADAIFTLSRSVDDLVDVIREKDD